MRKALRNGWKRICSVALAAAMVVTMLPIGAQAAVTSSSANADGTTFDNPVIYADVPDIDMIRVGNAYYMVSTTMHLSPGCPIMKSTDLVNWEIVNYVYDTLGDADAMNLRNGESMYGNGQWAASLKYYNNVYYVAFNCNTTGEAYLYTTDDIERGAWTKTTLNGFFHDLSLFFDDNGKGYLLYGGGEIKCAELSDDYKSVKKETEKTLFNIKTETWPEGSNIGTNLAGEGTHIMKKGEYYYVFNICWPQGGVRTEVCHRSKTFPGENWENKIILNANFQNNGVGGGVAQGAVIDTPEGKWYGFMFQDHGAIGRTPILTDCTWKEDWPMLGKDGDGRTVEAKMQLPVVGSDNKSLVKSDDFENDAEHRVFEAAQTASAAAQTYYAPKEGDAPVEMETVELVENGDFEGDKGTSGWSTIEGNDVKLEIVSEDDGTEKNKFLKVSGRTKLASSAVYDLSGQSMKVGETYTVSGKFKYTEGPDTKNFNITFENGPDWKYRDPKYNAIQAKKGEWVTFNFTYEPREVMSVDGNFDGTPEDYYFTSANCKVFFETPWHAGDLVPADDLMDFYLDDFSITCERPKKTEGEDPGEDPDDPGKDPETPDLSVIELTTNGNLETGTTDGWTTTPGETACTLAAVDTEKAGGTYSLHVSGRQSTGAGASQNLSGKMEVGKTYTVSGKLKYTEGADTRKFNVTVQHGANWQYRKDFLSFTAKKGEWTTFQGTYLAADKSAEILFDKDNVHMFIETPYNSDDKLDYYVDDFSVTIPNDNMAGDATFNQGVGPWVPFEGHGKIELVKPGRGGADDSCLKVSERTENWHGAGIVFGDRMIPGHTYNLKAYVKYDAATPAQQEFSFTMKGFEGDNTNPSYKGMASVTAKTGEWTEVTGKWTMPENARGDWTLYVNTGSAAAPHMDYYLDDVTITEEIKSETTEKGEHDYNGSNLDLVWQWNHNPNNNNWSLTEREGWLRLKTGNVVDSLLKARNTLTQRTFGPACSGVIRMDISKMNDGDVAGLGSLSFKYGYIAVKKEGQTAKLQMVDASQNNDQTKEDKPVVKATADCTADIVYLKEDFNYAGNADGSGKDTVTFYYSFDGRTWTKLGEAMRMTYELVHFMGSKFAIFNYATKRPGGYVDVDFFKVSDKITGDSTSTDVSYAELNALQEEVPGVAGGECEVQLKLDELTAANYKGLNASISIPNEMLVESVTFNTAAINGRASYSTNGNKLTLRVRGDNVSFKAEDKVFATIKLKINTYAAQNKAVEVSANYVRVDNGKFEYDVMGCVASIQLKAVDTNAIAKKLGYGNPIMSQALGADPYAMEYDGRVYVYMTADDYEYDSNGQLLDNSFKDIKTIRVVSSADLMNWTDHGEIPVAGPDGVAKWATNSWAPAIAHKTIDGKEKFFLYFANGGSGIGVLEGDSPLGPWKDPNGKALLTYGYPECQGVVWCFDPAVLVDDDGTGYIYFGGGVPDGQNLNPQTARVAQLTDDMVQIKDRTSYMIDAPCMFEDSGIFKYNGKYYYSYCSNFTPAGRDDYPGTGTICYMVSDNPMGPFTYAGEIFSNPSVWFGTPGNNHHATFVFEGESYFIYHAQTVAKELDKMKGYRSTHIDKIEMRADGTIKDIKGTYQGIPQLHTMNPYERIDAETIAWNAGVKVAPCNEPGKLFENYNTALTDLQDGDWTSVAQLDFGEDGATGIKVNAASTKGGTIEVHIDSPDGTLVGTVNVAAGTSEDTYQLATCKFQKAVTGVHNVFLVFKGTAAANETIMNVDYYQFEETPVKDRLASRIEKAENLLAGLTGDKKTELQKAITAAKAVADKAGATDEELKKALDDLTAVVDKLQKNAWDKLTDKIAEATKLLSQLAGEEKNKLQAAIDTANKMLNDETADEPEIEGAITKLGQSVSEAETAIEAVKAAKEELKRKIAEAEKLLAKLSGENKEKLQKVIDDIKALAEAGVVAEEDIQKAMNSLNTAVTEIEKKEELNGKIADAKALLNKLSGDKKAALQTVIDEIEKILSKPGVTEAEINQALAKLQTAIAEAQKPVQAEKPKAGESFTASTGLKYKVTAYSSKSKTVTIIGASKQITSLTIPDTVVYKKETFKVTAIADNAFANQKKLKSAVIGKNVTKIGKKAFYNCKVLAKVTFKGTAVKTIGKDAFKGIKKNASFKMTKSTFTYKNLKYKVTKCTTSVKQVTITGSSKKNITSLSVPATVKYNGMSFKVTAVNKKAFKKQKKLKSVTIGKNVKSIGASAFEGCSKLAKIKFSGTAIKSIGKNAFKGIKKNATFTVKKSKKAAYKKLLNKAKTKNYKIK